MPYLHPMVWFTFIHILVLAARGYTTLIFNQPPWPTKPGHPSVARRNEWQFHVLRRNKSAYYYQLSAHCIVSNKTARSHNFYLSDSSELFIMFDNKLLIFKTIPSTSCSLCRFQTSSAGDMIPRCFCVNVCSTINQQKR